MDQSPETTAPYGTPADQEPSNAVRGWQLLAERRGQELATARAQLDAYQAAEAARQLANEFPDAAELALRDGKALSASMTNELAATQRGIEAERESAGVFVHPNNPRRNAPTAAPPTIQDMERAAGDMFARRLAARDELGGI